MLPKGNEGSKMLAMSKKREEEVAKNEETKVRSTRCGQPLKTSWLLVLTVRALAVPPWGWGG